VDALFASGGPSSTGTMRRIQLMRAHRVYAELDAYEMLRRGDTSHDAQLMPGDVIYIPAIGPQVAIIGSVKEPGIYELKGDMTISSALDDVGGLTSLASTERALLERVDSGRLRRVDEFALDQMGRQRVLADGDVLRVFSISPKFENAVTVQGNVSHPGRFRWHEGMRISELFPTRESLLTREYWNQQNSLAANSSPMSLTAAQIATGMQTVAGVQALQLQANAGNPVLGQRAHWDQPISPSSAVRPDMLTGIIQSGARINWDYAVIERRDDRDLSTRLISFNLGNAIDNPASLDDQVVRAGDVIKVLSHNDVQVSQDKAPTLVRIAGEVNAPGIYRANPGETLRDLVIRAGGLTSRSYLYASQLTRISTRQSQEDQLRVASAEMQRELTAQFSSSRPLNTTGTAESQTQFSSQQALIAQLSSLKPTGRIVLDLKPDASGVNSIPAYPVEDGDSFYIPATVGTIQVAGSVYNPNAFRFQQGRQLSSYLNDAGGPTRQADEKRVFLIRADGRVVSKHGHNGLWGSKFESLTLLPGDAIIVPTKTKLNPMGSFAQQLPYLAQIISQTAMTGAAIGMAY
jgi:protein involved in polysaccharide export with SLBB domain